MECSVASFFQLFGVLSFFLVGTKAVMLICRIVYTAVGPLLRLNTDFKRMGQWAVVTGSTDGIGKAYAQELAKHGLDIVLISRSKEKLQNVAHEIESAYKVNTRVIAVDFTGGSEIYDVIRTGLEGLDVGVLVNNVGMAYFGNFVDISHDEKLFQDVIHCNIISLVTMTRMCLPQMIEKKKGVILNIASLSSVAPLPMSTVYSASKAFVDKFTMDLRLECRQHKDIIIQCVLPGFVVTKMIQTTEISLFFPSPQDYVRGHLKTVGLLDRTAGYLPHRFQLFFFELLAFFAPSVLYQIVLYLLQVLVRKQAKTAEQHRKRE